jgi:conjugal transfer/entry exclusion protein
MSITILGLAAFVLFAGAGLLATASIIFDLSNLARILKDAVQNGGQIDG